MTLPNARPYLSLSFSLSFHFSGRFVTGATRENLKFPRVADTGARYALCSSPRPVESYRNNLSTISCERSSPVSTLWHPHRGSFCNHQPAEHPRVFRPRARAGAAAVIFRFYHLRAQSRSDGHPNVPRLRDSTATAAATATGFDY